MSLTLLHKPLVDPVAILALVTTNAPETQHLEFKAEFWRREPPAGGDPAKDRRDEAAKDVAAMANALGGDIIIGIRERESRAAAYSDDARIPAEPRKALVDLLRQRIAPAAVAEAVLAEVREGVGPDGVARRVLVVTVPPWPHGPVGYRPSTGFEGYCFPRRDGAHTVSMGYDEMFARADAGNRRVYLQLLQAFDGSTISGIAFASRIGFSVGGLAGDLPLGRVHAAFSSVSESGLVCKILAGGEAMGAAAYAAATQAAENFESGVFQPSPESFFEEKLQGLNDRYPNQQHAFELMIPLGLVAEVWRDPQPSNLVHIALKADLLWAGHRWSLRT